MNEVKPIINITPLIDVLLVLLIIFMVISPMRPSEFETRIPSQSGKMEKPEHSHTLVVTVNKDSTLELNGATKLGSVAEPFLLQEELRQVFAVRLENHILNAEFSKHEKLSLKEKIQKTVFVKAPRSLAYGEVVKVIDAIKTAGADPISLQIDDIE